MVADAAAFRAQLLMQQPPVPPKPLVLSERSVFFQRPETENEEELQGRDGLGSAWLAMLIRDDGKPSSLRMWASLCDLNVTR